MSNRTEQSFRQLGKTFVVSSSSAPSLGVSIDENIFKNAIDMYDGNIRVFNPNDFVIWLCNDYDETLAQSGAVEAIAGTPSKSIPIAPRTIEVFNVKLDSYISAYSASTGTLYVTPGIGV